MRAKDTTAAFAPTNNKFLSLPPIKSVKVFSFVSGAEEEKFSNSWQRLDGKDSHESGIRRDNNVSIHWQLCTYVRTYNACTAMTWFFSSNGLLMAAGEEAEKAARRTSVGLARFKHGTGTKKK